MSQDFCDPELVADFIVEAKEHLETIEPNLLELEKAPDNLALLNEIFRPMHSLKGASGFLGLNRINNLAHKAENILDELRKGGFQVTPAIMDVILSATDALRQMIDSLETAGNEGDVETGAIVTQIEAIMNGGGVAAQPAAQPAVAQPVVAPAPVAPPVVEAAPQAVVPPAAPVQTAATSAGSESPAKTGTSGSEEDESVITSREWIDSRDRGQPYALTAFGEGHLRDFIDEAREIAENLNTGLLELEKNPNGDPELVNDLFRYFHNLKGNSGIIGFQELNSLTHEAETLLNRVRHGEMESSHELVDLLLLVVDMMDALSDQIDTVKGTAQPFDISEVLAQLQQAVAGGAIELPPALVHIRRAAAAAEQPEEQPVAEAQSAPGEHDNPQIVPMGAQADADDVDIFDGTVRQQLEIIRAALSELEKDGGQKECIDALYRSLVAVQKASSFMGQKDLSVYAERTAGLVNQGRSSGLDFSMMVDLLRQETSIISDMFASSLEALRAAAVPAEEASASDEAEATVSAEEASSDTPAETQASADSAASANDHPAPSPESPAIVPPKVHVEPQAVAQKIDVAPVKPVEAPKIMPVQEAKPAQAAPVAQAAPAAPTAPVAPAVAAGGLKTAAAAAAKPTDAGTEHKASSTIRVDHEKLDHLMNLIGELIINRNRYTMLARRLEDNGAQVDIAEVAQDLSETTYAMARISDDLQDTIMKVRMVPVSSVFSRFPRLVRDLSRKSGKEVDLILEGEETELDKSVVEVIGDPLTHLIRNAVDHGVEPEAERIAKGKPVKGRVVLRAYHKGNSVAIEIEDDGKGLDPEKLRDVAVRKGLLTQDEARQLDDREARELIFAPGFSSAEKITEISGRGVGMDVVRTNIKALKGSISIQSEVGKGTRFTLSLPLTLAIIDALMINVAGETFAIPLDAVSETTKIEARRLTDVKGRKAVTLRGEVLGIMNLAEMLNLPQKPLPDVLSVVVIHDSDRRLGLVVDRLLERQEIVIKPLGSYLGDVRGISGATIMGDGGVILILDPHEVYMMATSRGGSASGANMA